MACLPLAHRTAAAAQAAMPVLARRARRVVGFLAYTPCLVIANQGIDPLLPGGVRGPVRGKPVNGALVGCAAHRIAPRARATATCAASTNTARASASDVVRRAGKAVKAW